MWSPGATISRCTPACGDYRPEHLDHLLYTSREFFDYGGTLYVLPMGELPYWRVHMARRAADEKSHAFAAEHKQLLEALREDVSSRGPVANRDYAGRGGRGTFRSGKDTARAPPTSLVDSVS